MSQAAFSDTLSDVMGYPGFPRWMQGLGRVGAERRRERELREAAEQSRREQRREHFAECFGAHLSPAFEALARRAAEIDVARTGSSTSSVHTCEQLPTSDESAATAGEPPKQVTAATEAIRAAVSRDRSRQRKVIALIGNDEPRHALRLAKCGRRSVQLECPSMAGGCGSDDNYLPITCDSRLCPDCANRRMGQAIAKYEPHVEEMGHPSMLTLTMRNVPDPATGKEQIQDAFGKLRRRVIPAEGTQNGERWVWDGDGGVPAKYHWKRMLQAAGKRDLAAYLEAKYVSEGRGIPFDEIVRAGLYGIDIKQQEPGRYHVHIHVIIDCPYLPQPAVSAVWEDITGADVVDLRRLDQRGANPSEAALAEVVGYVCKPPEFHDESAEAEYLTAMKGARLIQPFGELHGNTERASGLLRCGECDRTPQWWNYVGTVEGRYNTMGEGWETPGDAPD